MEEFKERLLCYYTLPGRFIKEMELRGVEGTFLVAVISFIHCLIIFLLSGRKYWKVFLLPVMLVITLAIFSFVVFIIFKSFVNPKIDYCTVYKVIFYSYFMTLSIQLLIWLLIWLPDRFSFLIFLTYFGGLFYGYYLVIKGLSHRLKVKPFTTLIVILAALILCVVLDTGNNLEKPLSLIMQFR